MIEADATVAPTNVAKAISAMSRTLDTDATMSRQTITGLCPRRNRSLMDRSRFLTVDALMLLDVLIPLFSPFAAQACCKCGPSLLTPSRAASGNVLAGEDLSQAQHGLLLAAA